jgi:hypothetical protein
LTPRQTGRLTVGRNITVQFSTKIRVQSRAVKRVESQMTEREEPARIPVEYHSEVSSYLAPFSAQSVEDTIVIGECYHNRKNVVQLAIVLCDPINRFK